VQLGRERLGEGDDPGLGRVVGRHARAAEEARRRRDVEQVFRPLLRQARHEDVAAVEETRTGRNTTPWPGFTCE
jgi:hypothetical protein